MSTTTGGDLNLTKPALTDDHKVTIGTDLPANFQKIDDEFTAHLAEGVHQAASITNTDAATSTVAAPLKSAGGLAVAKNAIFGEGVMAASLKTDGAILSGCGNNVPQTIAALSAGLYIVTAYIASGGASFHSYAIIVHDGSTSSILHQKDAAYMTITLSGNNVQVTQSSGIANQITYAYSRIG